MARHKKPDFDWFNDRLNLITNSEIFKALNNGSNYVTTFKVGEWTVIKELFLAYYAPKYVSILKSRRTTLNYVDFFSGSGIVKLNEIGLNFPGSPLIVTSLISEHFTNYYFVDIEASKVNQLKVLLKGNNYNFYIGDANDLVSSLVTELRQNNSHSLILVDPYAMEFKFDSILALKDIECDLIITFSAEEISRAIYQWIQNPSWNTDRLDDFFGDSEWRKEINTNDVENSAIDAYFRRILSRAKKAKATIFNIRKTIGGHHYMIALVSTGGSRTGPSFHSIAIYFSSRIESISGDFVKKILDTYVTHRGKPIDAY